MTDVGFYLPQVGGSSNSLESYLTSLTAIPILSADEEASLFESFQQNDSSDFINISGSLIDLSTWLSAAKCITISG